MDNNEEESFSIFLPIGGGDMNDGTIDYFAIRLTEAYPTVGIEPMMVDDMLRGWVVTAPSEYLNAVRTFIIEMRDDLFYDKGVLVLYELKEQHG